MTKILEHAKATVKRWSIEEASERLRWTFAAAEPLLLAHAAELEVKFSFWYALGNLRQACRCVVGAALLTEFREAATRLGHPDEIFYCDHAQLALEGIYAAGDELAQAVEGPTAVLLQFPASSDS